MHMRLAKELALRPGTTFSSSQAKVRTVRVVVDYNKESARTDLALPMLNSEHFLEAAEGCGIPKSPLAVNVSQLRGLRGLPFVLFCLVRTCSAAT